MIKKIIYTLCFLMILTNINAQEKINKVLAEIAKNNISIIANQQYWEAKKLQYKTGLTPADPSVEFEYLLGSPADAGNQTDFFVLQSFDFPSVYKKKKQVANQQIAQAAQYLIAFRQEVLLKAKQHCITLVYLNKKQTELQRRLQNAEQLYSDYQQKLDKGDANILTVNKTKLLLLNLQNDLRLNAIDIDQYHQKLTALNGGIPIAVTDTIYDPIAPISDFQTLINAIETYDPVLKTLQQQNEINLTQVEVIKALALPKMRTGFRSQNILGQKYKGTHLGITIPLWENKNRVESQEAQSLFSELQIEQHKNQRYHQARQLYEKSQNLKITLEQYQELLTTVNNTELLEKALKLGEISSIEYFMEIRFFYSAYDKFLQMEEEYHQVVAALYKYQL